MWQLMGLNIDIWSGMILFLQVMPMMSLFCWKSFVKLCLLEGMRIHGSGDGRHLILSRLSPCIPISCRTCSNMFCNVALMMFFRICGRQLFILRLLFSVGGFS